MSKLKRKPAGKRLRKPRDYIRPKMRFVGHWYSEKIPIYVNAQGWLTLPEAKRLRDWLSKSIDWLESRGEK